MSMTPLAVAETDRIAALLAEVTGPVARRPRAEALVSEVLTPPPQAEPVPPAEPPAVAGVSVADLLGQANWRNETRRAGGVSPPVLSSEDRGANAPRSPSVGPLPAPFGVLRVAELFGLMNWRNRPDEARPRPVITPPPPPGAEFTVAAVLPTFSWE